MVGRGVTGMGSTGREPIAGDWEKGLSSHGEWEQWYALAILAQCAEAGERVA